MKARNKEHPVKARTDGRPDADGVVSVIIPTYNRSEYLEEAVDSVASQTYRPIEVVVVDDGSTDGTRELIEEKIRENQSDDFSIVYLCQQNQGAPAARNFGLREASGEFIQFLDSDDFLHPNKLELQVQALNDDPSCDFAWSKHAEVRNGDRDQAVEQTWAVQEEACEIAVPLGNMPPTVWLGVFRKNSLSEIGPWNTKLKMWQDLEYSVRFACSGIRRIRFVEGVFYYQRVHSGGRIRDLCFSSEGIRAGLDSLGAIESTVTRYGKWTPALGRNVGRFYLILSGQGMQHGSRSLAFKSLFGAVSLPSPVSFKAKVSVTMLILLVAGRSRTLKVLSRYYPSAQN